jgi:hypothetical protein
MVDGDFNRWEGGKLGGWEVWEIGKKGNFKFFYYITI